MVLGQKFFFLHLPMITSFSEHSESAKVWVYPSSRKFYDTEISELELKITLFLNHWLEEDKVSYQLLYNRFLVISVDKENAIPLDVLDQLVAFIFQLQTDYDVVLIDRMNVCFKQGDFVQYKDLKEFQKLIKQKAVSNKTIVFDNLVETKHDFEQYWEVPITESWYSRFIK